MASSWSTVSGEIAAIASGDYRAFTKHCDWIESVPVAGGLQIKALLGTGKVALSRLPSIKAADLTPLGEPMQIGGMRVLPRPETRRTMLVLTDGTRGCEGSEPAAIAHAQHVAGMIGRAGIELIGVGVQDDALQKIVAETIVVHELKDLPAQL